MSTPICPLTDAEIKREQQAFADRTKPKRTRPKAPRAYTTAQMRKRANVPPLRWQESRIGSMLRYAADEIDSLRAELAAKR